MLAISLHCPSSFPTLESCESESENLSVVSNSLRPHWLHSPWTSPGQNTGVSNLSLLQGFFPTQGPPHYRQILYQLNHKGSPWNPIPSVNFLLHLPWKKPTLKLLKWQNHLVFWMTLVFESVDWVKQIALLNVGGHLSIYWWLEENKIEWQEDYLPSDLPRKP